MNLSEVVQVEGVGLMGTRGKAVGLPQSNPIFDLPPGVWRWGFTPSGYHFQQSLENAFHPTVLVGNSVVCSFPCVLATYLRSGPPLGGVSTVGISTSTYIAVDR